MIIIIPMLVLKKRRGYCKRLRPSSRHAIFLLNYCVEFNQTRYMTFAHGKSVREHHYFLTVRHPSICPSHYLLLP